MCSKDVAEFISQNFENLSAKNVEDILLFCTRVGEAESKSSLRRILSRQKLVMKFNWKEGEPLKIESNVPSYDELASFISLFRQFYMDSSTIQFQRVVKMLTGKDRCTNIKVQRRLIAWGKAFNDIDNGKKDYAPFTFNNKPQTPKIILKTYFYGSIFHSDDKILVKNVENLESALGPFYWHYFVINVYNLFVCVRAVKKIITGEIKV